MGYLDPLLGYRRRHGTWLVPTQSARSEARLELCHGLLWGWKEIHRAGPWQAVPACCPHGRARQARTACRISMQPVSKELSRSGFTRTPLRLGDEQRRLHVDTRFADG